MRGLVAGLAVAVFLPAAAGPPALAAGTAAVADQAARYLKSLAVDGSGPPAQPLGPEAQKVAKSLAERFGARVLRAQRGDVDGRPVYRVVVMRPGGNFDDAYSVATLTVDAKTGELLPQFRNEASGYRLSAPPDRTPRDGALATTIRRESFRKTD